MTNPSTRCREAYLRCLPALRALAPHELREVDLEVDAAVSTILNTLPTAKVLRPLLSMLRGVDMKAVDNVEGYALAALYTHLRREALVPRDLDELLEVARQERAELCHAVLTLPPHVRGTSTDPQSPDELARDMLWRVELVRGYLHDMVPEHQELEATLEVVTEVELLAEEILAWLAAPRDDASVEQLTDERRRAFTLCIVAYEDKLRPAIVEVCRRKHELQALAHAYALQSVAEELGPEALRLLNPDRGRFGEN